MIKDNTVISSGVDWLLLLKDNWTWAAPFTYIYVTTTGMVQAWMHFNAFGINVFEFSEINDFILAAFREPLSFFAILGLIAYSILLFVIPKVTDPIMEAFFKLLGKPIETLTGGWALFLSSIRRFFYWLNIIAFVVIVFGAPYYVPKFLHDEYGDKWKKEYLSNPKNKVSVIFRDIGKSLTKTEWSDTLVFIGTTDKFLFFYDQQTKRILTVPISNVFLLSRPELSNKANPADAAKRRS